jgi:WD40 repeat protein
VAGLLGLGLDEIVRRAERARRRRLGIGFAVLSLVLAIVAGFAVWAEFNRRTARRNLSSALTGLALSDVDKRPVDAAKFGLAAWPRQGALDLPKREVTLNAISRSLAGLHERMRITTSSSVISVAFSPDGKRLLAGSEDKTARIWDIATGKEVHAFNGHEEQVNSVAFDPRGALVLTGSNDKTARLWDAATGKEMRAFKGHEGAVLSVAFSPDGARVLTGSWDKTARLWDAATGKEIRAFKGEDLPVIPSLSARMAHTW